MAKRNAIINIRATEEQKALIETVAEAQGLTVSEWSRKVMVIEAVKQYKEIFSSQE